MRKLISIVAAVLTLVIFGAGAASACEAPAAQSLPVVGMIFAGVDNEGSEDTAMISTASDCWSPVVVNEDRVPTFRDYAATADGTLSPITFCEGEDGPRFLEAYAGDLAAEDGMPYVIGELV